jgi:hypothetical protein
VNEGRFSTIGNDSMTQNAGSKVKKPLPMRHFPAEWMMDEWPRIFREISVEIS